LNAHGRLKKYNAYHLRENIMSTALHALAGNPAFAAKLPHPDDATSDAAANAAPGAAQSGDSVSLSQQGKDLAKGENATAIPAGGVFANTKEPEKTDETASEKLIKSIRKQIEQVKKEIEELKEKEMDPAMKRRLLAMKQSELASLQAQLQDAIKNQGGGSASAPSIGPDFVTSGSLT
jgi:DNA-binding transcriptional MerR regulator